MIVHKASIYKASEVFLGSLFVIELGPSAFYSEIELANTIAHEVNHARSFMRGGDAPEEKAYPAGNALEDYIRGRR